MKFQLLPVFQKMSKEGPQRWGQDQVVGPTAAKGDQRERETLEEKWPQLK